MKRSPIRRRSAKASQAMVYRRELRAHFMRAHPRCERCGEWATDCHEIIRRSQAKDAALRPELFVALCRSCHRFVTEHPEQGHDEGFVLWSWEDNLEALETARAKRRKASGIEGGDVFRIWHEYFEGQP